MVLSSVPPRGSPFQASPSLLLCPSKAALSRTRVPLPIPGPILTGQLLELRQDRLKEVVVDLVSGTVVSDEEEIFHRHWV